MSRVTLQPALALVLAQHLHHTTGGREKFIAWNGLGVPLAIGRLKKRFEAVGKRLIGTEHPEIPLRSVEFFHIAQERPQHVRIADALNAWRGHLGGIVAEIGHPQIAQQNASVGVRIRAHAPFALGRQFRQFRFQAALFIEEFLRPVALQPVFQQFEVLRRSRRGNGKRYLMRTERALDLFAAKNASAPSSLWVN